MRSLLALSVWTLPRPRLVLAAASASLLFATTARAEEVVRLRDGSVVHGHVVSQANGVVTVETMGGTLTIPQEKILEIRYGEPETAAPAAMPPATPPPEQPAGPEPAATPMPVPAAPSMPEYRPSYPSPAAPPYAPRRIVRPVAEMPFAMEATLGGHIYSGKGWSDDPNTPYLAGPAIEMLARAGLQTDPLFRIDGIVDMGVYGGSRDCLDVPGPCTPVSATTGYAEIGLRGTFVIDPLYLYVQGGGGGTASSIRFGDPGSASAIDDTGGSGSGHLALGAGVAIDRFLLFGQAKFTTARTRFSVGDMQMGGTTISGGLGMCF